MAEEDVTKSAEEGIIIERERKYIIPNQNITRIIAQNLPDELEIAIPSVNESNEALSDISKDVFSTRVTGESIKIIRATKIVKHRPYHYFDTNNYDLQKNHISFSLRERDNDWLITVKILPKLERDGIMERIEFNSLINDDLIRRSRNNNNISIDYLIHNKRDLREIYTKRIRQFTKGKELVIKDSFIVDSVSADYPLAGSGQITVSVDDIITHDQNLENLFELEIEIKFGPSKSWIDTMLLRVFDYLCSIITNKIKNKIKNELNHEIVTDLFTKLTYLSKIERIRHIPERSELVAPTSFNEDVIFMSLEGRGHEISYLSNFLAQIMSLQQITSKLPLVVCSYWVSITQTYSDVKPSSKETLTIQNENDIDDNDVIRNIDVAKLNQTFRTHLLDNLTHKFEKIIKQVVSNPDLLIDRTKENNISIFKIIILKLTQTSFLITSLYPSQSSYIKNTKTVDDENLKLFFQSKELLLKFLSFVKPEFKDRDIYKSIQIDCSFLFDKLILDTRDLKAIIKNISLIRFNKQTISQFKDIINRNLTKGERKLNNLIRNRYHLGNSGVRGPLISIEDKQNFAIEIFSDKLIFFG